MKSVKSRLAVAQVRVQVQHTCYCQSVLLRVSQRLRDVSIIT